jgi:hypothetical protein
VAVLADPRVGEAELRETPRPAAVELEVTLVDERQRRRETELVQAQIGDRERQEAKRVVTTPDLEAEDPVGVEIDEDAHRTAKLDPV